MPKYDDEGDVKFPACLDCEEYDKIFEVEGGVIVGEFCETAFDGNCKRRRRAKNKNA
jgi:hypothetical protein